MLDPWHWTLLTFAELLDVERLQRFERRSEALERAKWASMAFNEPKRLKGEHERLEREMQGKAVRRPVVETHAEAKATVAAISKGFTAEPI